MKPTGAAAPAASEKGIENPFEKTGGSALSEREFVLSFIPDVYALSVDSRIIFFFCSVSTV